ncbi:sugar kinase [Legionella sp. W05-934-2]|uniref:sugar kinase n=1 Tax=Legionella sp. W05-934-2 TaxID=1198649 RepID=UPI003461C994
MKIAAVGECLIELTEYADNLMALNYAGDTYNTCYYLAQLNKQWQIAYVTALGVDPYSQAMLQTWKKLGIHSDLCLQFENKIPGLYLVNTDDLGERSFYYYRHQSAASQWLTHPDINACLEAILDYDYLYLSGISFAILMPAERVRLLEFVSVAKTAGVGIVYDNNYRPKLWSNPNDAQHLAKQMCQLSDCFFVTHDDEAILFGDANANATFERYQAYSPPLLVVKDGARPCLVSDNGQMIRQSPPVIEKVIDTTGAGDAFNAGFLSAYWQGKTIEVAIKKASQLASAVIQCRGAILPMGHFEQKAGLADG